MSESKPVIVVSASRFFQGGTVAITGECLKVLDQYASDKYAIKAIVFKKNIYPELKNVEYIEIPDMSKFFLKRIYAEYIRFNKLSKKWKPYLWISMQDSTPKVVAEKQIVYFHNPLINNKLKTSSLFIQPKLFFLKWLYKNVYIKNIETNDFIICQQQTLINYFKQQFTIPDHKFILFPPRRIQQYDKNASTKENSIYSFVFPATAFMYKNFDVLLKAAKLLHKKRNDFEITLTITGRENAYTRNLLRKYAAKNIHFSGFQPKEKLLELYQQADCMVFPSEVETWGLPLSEFSILNKPIICSDLPYARETLNGYNKVKFFNQRDPKELMHLMEKAITNELTFDENPSVQFDNKVNNWLELFQKTGLQLS